MENKLLPCPFCGGVPSVGCAGVCAKHSGQSTDYFVSCFSCGASTQRYFDTTDEAVTAWNRRAAPANPPLMLEQLREMDADMETRPWVWIQMLVSDGRHESAYYRVQSDYTRGRSFCCGFPGMGFAFDYSDYGKTWLAYAHKNEEDA